MNLDTKYQNLATEYSKVSIEWLSLAMIVYREYGCVQLRANAAVLKKAVLDEQARSRELKEQLKEHEQRLRKSNQEMESLTFRNQQLTKRISVLQDELDVRGAGGRRNKGKSSGAVGSDNKQPTARGNMSLLDEELQKKIMDNAQLISAVRACNMPQLTGLASQRTFNHSSVSDDR